MLKFGFIGCGKMAGFHADAVRALDHDIVGVSGRPGSRNIADFSKLYGIANSYQDWREMIEEERPDALVVSVSWDQTEGIIQEIVNSGLPSLVEKPVALSSSALQKIMANTAQYHDRIMVGYNRRFYDFMPLIKQALDEQELISIDLNFPEPLGNLMKTKSPKIAKYILIYMSSHWLDLLISLIGELKVESMSKKRSAGPGHVEAYNGILRSIRYDIPVHLKANFDAPSNTAITFNFRDSIYKLCPIEVLNIYKGMESIEPSGEVPIRRYVPHVEKTRYTDTKYKPGVLKQMECFIETCVHKKTANGQGCTLDQALEVTRICEEIERS
ncbi:MAG: Gfo/Idh/MocA family oxidoreductase [Candidatus Omnitrophica bacterium]|nr:Gfo/Idh/MocA family oxidoreductase [Candidatus Omnitrophota bacterium]